MNDAYLNGIYDHSNLINTLIRENNYKSYLEIGVANPEDNYNKIVVENKECVDPYTIYEDGFYDFCLESVDENKKNIITYNMTSDEMFSKITSDKKYDIIFIDGLHEKYQVMRDILNSMEHLNDNGVILVHDTIPVDKLCGSYPREVGYWTGDVWKAIVVLYENNIDYFTIDIETGVTLIPKQSIDRETLTDNNVTYEDVFEHIEIRDKYLKIKHYG